MFDNTSQRLVLLSNTDSLFNCLMASTHCSAIFANFAILAGLPPVRTLASMARQLQGVVRWLCLAILAFPRPREMANLAVSL